MSAQRSYRTILFALAAVLVVALLLKGIFDARRQPAAAADPQASAPLQPLYGDTALAMQSQPRLANPTTAPLISYKQARQALHSVGVDPEAEAVWVQAINDPNLRPGQRSDLIEDLNEHGFANSSRVTPEELPIVLNRLDLIERLSPHAMDKTNADAFAEAHKDLRNIAARLLAP